MKSIIQSYVLITGVFLSASALSAEQSSTFTFVGLGHGLNNTSIYLDDQQLKADSNTNYQMGVGKTFWSSDSWRADGILSLRYGKNHFSGVGTDGRVSETGLWASSRFNYLDGPAGITPFIEVGAGLVELDVKSSQFNFDDRTTAYEVQAGLTFELTEDVSFSFAVGYSDAEDVHHHFQR